MADNNSYRSHRQNDPFARPQQSAESPDATGAQNDPLAELARLIGQSDPFADFGRSHAAPVPLHSAAEVPPPDWGAGSTTPSAYTNPPPETTPLAGASYPTADPYQAVDAYQAADPYQAAPPVANYAPVASDPRMETPRYDSPTYGEQNDDAAAAFQPAAFAPAAFAAAASDAAPAAAPGYEPDPYFRGDPNVRAPNEDFYEDAPAPQRRSRLALATAVVTLAVVGTAGAYAYRTYFGEADVAKPPPVIRADAAPSKVVPPTNATNSQSGKLINDRIGEPNQGERVVSREEEPVDIRSAPAPATPRVVFPGPVPNAASGSAFAGSNAPAPSRPSSVLGEPKRVRTVTIRPNQPAIPAVPQSAPAAALQQPAAPAAAAAPAPAPDPAPVPAPRVASAPPVSVEFPPTAPRTVAPRRVQRAPQPIAAPTPSRNAPLSLTPQGTAIAPAPARVRTRTAAAPSPPVASGGYNVQVTSQRSETAAQASFRTLQARYPTQLGGRSPIIRQVNLGARGIYYRAMVGPFPSVEQASSLCSRLKAAGGQCVVQRN